MPTVILVRHGQASFGAADYDRLSPLGERQGRIAGETLRRQGGADRVLSGGLRRQRETAAALGLGSPEVDRRWDEVEVDELLAVHGDGRARLTAGGGPAIASRDFQTHLDAAVSGWIAAGEGSPCKQTWPRFERVALAALEAAATVSGKGETTVAVTSAGVIAAISGSLLGCAATAFAPLNRVQVNAAITKIAIGSRGASLISLNDHSHLAAVDRELVTYR